MGDELRVLRVLRGYSKSTCCAAVFLRVYCMVQMAKKLLASALLVSAKGTYQHG